VIVTAATGFVGKALTDRLHNEARFVVSAAVRFESKVIDEGIKQCVLDDFVPGTDWGGVALRGVEVVVHLAARVHLMRDTAADPLKEFLHINTDGTLNLARQAAAAGVDRFIYLSSIKVNGEATHHGYPFTHNDLAAPQDPYGISKHKAEVGLRKIARTTGMQVVIIRPTLVYGKGAKGNFKSLMKLVARGLPLPLASIDNRRSLVGIDNLVDFIVMCLEHPDGANETFLVSDGEDLSTPDLIRRMARAINRPARLLPMPKSLIMAGAIILGKREMAQRLCGSLQVDISKSRTLLGWNPPVSVDEGLRRVVGRD